MKRNLFLVLVAMLTLAWGCQKDEIINDDLKAEMAVKVTVAPVEGPDYLCGEPVDCTLWAGRNIDAGVFTVGNDGENLYLHFDATGEWLVKEVHFWVGTDLNKVPKNKPGNIVVGSFPYKYSFNPFVGEAFFSLSLDELDLEVGDEIFVVAHAVVVKLNHLGEIIANETAFGGCFEGNSGNRWWYYTTYMVQDCDPTNFPPCVWEEQTAYGGNTAGNGNAWWFYFDIDGPATQAIYAGQKLVDGAFVTYANGVITIITGDDLRLQAVGEAVKIMGYDVLPESRPASGASNPNQIYAGNSLEIPVDSFNFYVIHLDAEVQVCPER